MQRYVHYFSVSVISKQRVQTILTMSKTFANKTKKLPWRCWFVHIAIETQYISFTSWDDDVCDVDSGR